MRTARAFLTLLLFPLLALGAVTVQVGERIELKSTHHQGVPLHDEPRGTDDFQRVSDGTQAEVLEISAPNQWLRLRISDGREGWISPKYVGRVVPGGGAGPGNGNGTPVIPPAEAERRVWESRQACAEIVQAGGRLAREIPDTLRAGTWNVRWFPRGCSSSESCAENATDLDWLACAITWMDVDVLAVQEILETPDAVTAMDSLRGKLNTLTGGSWQIDLNDCGAPGSQHIGFLWNGARVNVTGGADSCALNGAATPTCSAADACFANLRPGRYVRVQSRRPDGADFHILSAHFDSGRSNRDFQNRRTATERIPFLEIGGAPLLDSDRDLIVLGDLNTMGREETPQISASEELSLFDEELAPGFERLIPQFQCSEYFQGHGGLLDHIVLSAGMQEDSSAARLSGYCAVARCASIQGAMPAAYERLSDHCPILFEVIDQDLDEE